MPESERMRQPIQSDEARLARVRSEYLEMPGLSLTRHQAQRLWGLDMEACGDLLDELLCTGFLRRTARGEYVRADRS